MTGTAIRKSDIVDADIVDAYELSSDGYEVYLTTTAVSTDSGTQTIVINLPSDAEGLTSIDNPAQADDRVYLIGSSGADGYYIIASIIDDITFTVNPPISSSTGGTIYFMYQSGALNVGFDPTNKIDIAPTSTNVQAAINDLDQNKLDKLEHEKLRQLIHFLNDGPGVGFLSGAYKVITPTAAVFPTNVCWYTDNTMTQKIFEKVLTWTIPSPTQIVYNMYDSDGVTVVESATDTITYVNNVFESSRTRVFTPNM